MAFTQSFSTWMVCSLTVILHTFPLGGNSCDLPGKKCLTTSSPLFWRDARGVKFCVISWALCRSENLNSMVGGKMKFSVPWNIIELIPGVLEFLRSLNRQHIASAVATS